MQSMARKRGLITMLKVVFAIFINSIEKTRKVLIVMISEYWDIVNPNEKVCGD